MSTLTLYLGNKNYSSWSMRAGLAVRLSGAAFREERFDLAAEGVRDEILRLSPAGKVPFLRAGDVVIWDSMAIFEYLAETCTDVAMWPRDPAARAVARAVAAEMHAGFPRLRASMPMNIRRSSPGKGRDAGVAEEIERIGAIWRDCRERFGAQGTFLFGDWSLADVAYAPVVSRFRTYAVQFDDRAEAYAAAVRSRPEFVEWCAAAETESSHIASYDL